MRLLCVVCLVAVPFGASVQAAIVIFDNFGPGYAYTEWSAWTVCGSATGTDCDSAMGFTPSATSALHSIAVGVTFWVESGDNSLDLSLYDDAGGAPGPNLLESWVIGGMPAAGTDNSPVWALSILNPVLSSASSYWLVASAGTDIQALGWSDNEIGDLGQTGQRLNEGAWGTGDESTRGAFQVNGADGNGVIPEPSSLALVGLGIAGLLARRRRGHA